MANKKITAYWLKHYVSPEGLCTLCGNIGIIDTTLTTSYAGVVCGRINCCICPNGQAIRKLNDA